MPAKLWNIPFQTNLTKQGGNLSSESPGWGIFVGRTAQDFAYFLFHTSPMPAGAPLQTRLYLGLQIPDHELRHIVTSALMISRYHPSVSSFSSFLPPSEKRNASAASATRESRNASE